MLINQIYLTIKQFTNHKIKRYQFFELLLSCIIYFAIFTISIEHYNIYI